MAVPVQTRIAAQAVRLELARRAWSTTDLARHAGLDPQHLTNLLCGNSRSVKGRKKINQALGLDVFNISSGANNQEDQNEKTTSDT
jgi:lambda repressor-like predicted transcriptional regulator